MNNSFVWIISDQPGPVYRTLLPAQVFSPLTSHCVTWLSDPLLTCDTTQEALLSTASCTVLYCTVLYCTGGITAIVCICVQKGSELLISCLQTWDSGIFMRISFLLCSQIKTNWSGRTWRRQGGTECFHLLTASLCVGWTYQLFKLFSKSCKVFLRLWIIFITRIFWPCRTELCTIQEIKNIRDNINYFLLPSPHCYLGFYLFVFQQTTRLWLQCEDIFSSLDPDCYITTSRRGRPCHCLYISGSTNGLNNLFPDMIHKGRVGKERTKLEGRFWDQDCHLRLLESE